MDHRRTKADRMSTQPPCSAGVPADRPPCRPAGGRDHVDSAIRYDGACAGMGHPTTVEALKRLDQQVKSVLDGSPRQAWPSIQRLGDLDHGFATTSAHQTSAPSEAVRFNASTAHHASSMVRRDLWCATAPGSCRAESSLNCRRRPASARSSRGHRTQDRCPGRR